MRGRPSNSVQTQRWKPGGVFVIKRMECCVSSSVWRQGPFGGPCTWCYCCPSTGNSLGQTVLGMSRTQMLIKGTNQEQTSFQNTCRRRYKHQLPGTFWVNLLPSVCVKRTMKNLHNIPPDQIVSSACRGFPCGLTHIHHTLMMMMIHCTARQLKDGTGCCRQVYLTWNARLWKRQFKHNCVRAPDPLL